MAISSPTVIQGKENPLVSALKYANDQIKSSLQLMQNAKQLKLVEQEQQATKQINIFNGLTKMYNDAVGTLGPITAFEQYGDLLGGVMSSMGMSDASIGAWKKGMATAPFASQDITTKLLNDAITGKGSLAGVGPAEIEKEYETIMEKITVAGQGQVTGEAMVEREAPKGEEKAEVLAKGSVRMNQLKSEIFQEYQRIFARDTQGGLLAEDQIGTANAWYDSLRLADRQEQFRKYYTTRIQQDFLQGNISIYEAQILLNDIRKNTPIPNALDLSVRNLSPVQIFGKGTWASGQNAPTLTGPVPGTMTEGGQAAAMASERRVLQEEQVAGASQALGSRPQGKARPTSGATKEQVELDKELRRVSLTVVGQGPPPEIVADPRKVNAWKEVRKQTWLDRKEVDGVGITPQLAQSLADHEALLRPVAKEVAKKVPKTNVPVVSATEPPTNYAASGAKQAMVPPFVAPDAIPDGPAWKAANSFYDRWAKRAAGVEFGKGDQLRESKALRDFSAALPTRSQRYAEMSSEAYYNFLGGGDSRKGQQLFVAQVNEAAFSAQTQRMQEGRISEKVFKVSPELAKLVSMPDLAGKVLNTQQFEAVTQLAQIKAVTGVVVEWSKTQEGTMLMEMLKNSVEFLKVPFQKAYEGSGGDKENHARAVEALKGNPLYSGHMDFLEGITSLMTGGTIKPNMVQMQGIFAKVFNLTQPGPGIFVPAGGGSQEAPQAVPLTEAQQKVHDAIMGTGR